MKFKIEGLDDFERAIENNPEVVINELKDFFQRAIAIYKGIVWNNPWRMGGYGGGVPVALVEGGTLRSSHKTAFEKWSARLYQDDSVAPYGKYVHGIEGFPRTRTYQLRPWLDYAFKQGEQGVREKEKLMLENIVKKLAQ